MTEINSISGLDALLAGNPPAAQPNNESPPTEAPEPATETPEATDPTDAGETTDPAPQGDAGNGGDPNLESEGGTEKPEEGVPNPQESKANAAFARMRTEMSEANKVIMQLAKALDLDVNDPIAARQMLQNMSANKLAEKAQLPLEVYNELNTTKEQLAQIQYQQRQVQVRDSLLGIKDQYGLSDKEIMDFANKLDAEGVNPIQNPNVDLEYEFYRRNRDMIEKKRIEKAVAEALRKSNTADKHSSTPSKQQGKGAGIGETPKVNSVSALNDLLKG